MERLSGCQLCLCSFNASIGHLRCIDYVLAEMGALGMLDTMIIVIWRPFKAAEEPFAWG